MNLREVIASFSVRVEGVDKLKAADRAMNQVMKRFQKLGQALAGGAVVLGIKNFVQGQVELATGLDQTARILGVTTDELQQFHLAAELSNTSVEAVDSALRFLNRTIGSDGGKGIGAKGAKELRGLGIALQGVDGKSRPVIDVFADLADKLKATGDQGKATEIAMQVLGRGGARALPLLLQGGEALRAKFAELRKLGGGISPEAVAAAKGLQVEEVRLKYATESVKSAFMTGFAPALGRGIERIVQLTVAFKDLASRTTVFQSLPLFVYAAGIAAGIFTIVKTVRLLGAALGALGYSTPAIAALTLAATGLYFIFDDLFGLFKEDGTVSGIGMVLDQMFGQGYSTEFVKEVKKDWSELLEQFKSDDWGEFFKTIRDGTFNAVKGMIQLVEAIKLVYHAVKGGSEYEEAAAAVQTAIESGDQDAVDKAVANLDKVKAKAKGRVDNDLDQMVGDADLNKAAKNTAAVDFYRRDFVTDQNRSWENRTGLPAPALPPPPAPTINMTVNIHGVKDAGKVPKAIKDQLDKVQTDYNNTYPAIEGY